MYLHIGNNKMIKIKDIIGIFDSDTATVSKITRSWLTASEKNGELSSASGEVPKAIVLVGNRKNEKVYFSQLATKTLCARAEKY